MEENVLGTTICPKDFATAATRHGRHFARYLLAARHARGRRVLDAACGGGFGSAYLASVGESVLGLDLDEQMIALARETYAAENVRFEIHDLHDSLALWAGGPFGLITSFETMEHVKDPAKCLAGLTEVMADDAVALISVPNGTKELRDGDTKEYHQVHFSAEEFDRLLKDRFGEVEPLSQVYRKNWRHYLRKLTGRRGHHSRCYAFAPGFLDDAKTWLAVCRKPLSAAHAGAVLPDPSDSLQGHAEPDQER